MDPSPIQPPDRLRRLQIEITTGCNLRCVGCQRTIGMKDRSWRNTHMPIDRFRAIIRNAPPSQALILQGIGEPTLHPSLGAMIDEARAAGKFDAISFNTNALVRKTAYYARLKARGLGHISISVDSLEPETAEALRAGTDCDRLAAAITDLTTLFEGNVTLSVVLSRRNVPELPSLLPRLHALGARTVEIQPLISYAPEVDSMALSPDELAAARAGIDRISRGLPGFRTLLAPSFTPDGSRCKRPFHAGYVTVGGYLTPCCTTNDETLFSHTSLATQSWDEAWLGEGVQGWLSAYAAQEPQICVGCAYNPSATTTRVEPTLERAQAFQAAGRLEEAEAEFRGLLNGANVAEALKGMGLIHYQRGEAAAALPLLQAARALQPDPVTTHNCAILLDRLGRRAEAIVLERDNIAFNPEYVPSYGALTQFLRAEGDAVGAMAPMIALAERAMLAGRRDYVTGAVDGLIGLGGDHPRLIGLANRLRIGGHQDEAARLLQARLTRAPGDLGARLALAMARLAIIHGSQEEIASRRQAYAHDLRDLEAQVLDASQSSLAEAASVVGEAKPFILAYQGGDDRDLQSAYGGVVTRMMAAACPPPPSPSPARARSGGRLRVGFATAYFHNHSVSKLFGGWIRHLDRSRFEVLGYDFSEAEDDCSRRLAAACDGFTKNLGGHEAWAQAIAADGLDVLIYPEIGMHHLPVQLASRRLAPVQCMAWGHPVSSGLPNIDYFLSSDLMEPPDGERHYAETLVRLPGLSIHYDPLPAEGGRLSRADIGLRPDAVVYVCCQALFKYLPQHDAVWAAIAARVPNAQLLFIGDMADVNAAAVHARMSAAFVAAGLDPARQLVFAKPVEQSLFPSLLRAGDVNLDSIGWSGGNTTLEALTCGLPVISLPTDLMRGRHTAAMLTMMGLDQCIAADVDGYVAMAAALADDAARSRLVGLVAERRSRLFGDLEPVRALEDFLQRSVLQDASGRDEAMRLSA